MKCPYYRNDQAYIAEQSRFLDIHTAETSLLASYKINSYKLALTSSAYCASKEELQQIINNTLLFYVVPDVVLLNEGFFEAVIDN